MQRWEYRVLVARSEEGKIVAKWGGTEMSLVRALNEAGDVGWELVSTSTWVGAEGLGSPNARAEVLYLKRPLV